MTFPRTPDVLVIGAGVIGCAIARALAGAGRSVVVVDRGAIGGGASSAAAGVLGVASGDDEGDRLALRRAGLDRFPDLASALRDEVGADVGFERCGVVALAETDEELAAQAARIERRRAEGYRVEACDASGVRALEPMVGPSFRGGAHFPDDAVVVAERLVEALAESARRRGAVLVPGVPVLAVERAGERVVRVRAGDTWVAPGCVVVATGAWGDLGIDGLDVGVEVVPVRGQMLAVRPARLPARVVTWGPGFLIPRPNGEVWVGATFEDAGFANAVTVDGLRALASHVARLAPALADAPVTRAWAGLRPLRRDGGPVIGRPRGLANVLVALGHFRNGILLAPVTAHAVRAIADGTDVPAEARPFTIA